MKTTLSCFALVLACSCSKDADHVYAKSPANPPSTTHSTDSMPSNSRAPASTPAVPRTTESTPTPTPPRSTEPMPPQPKPPVVATDQSNDEQNVDLTRRVRQALMDDATLSTMAKNVVIVSTNGSVVLTGEVASSDEKAQIETLAKGVLGALSVDNQITVKP